MLADFPFAQPVHYCDNVLALTRIGDDTTYYYLVSIATTRHFVPPFLMASLANISLSCSFAITSYSYSACVALSDKLHALILGDVIFSISFIFFTGFGT